MWFRLISMLAISRLSPDHSWLTYENSSRLCLPLFNHFVYDWINAIELIRYARWQHYANQNKCIPISNKTEINSKRRHQINHVITFKCQMQHSRTFNTYTNCSEFCFVFSSFFRLQAIFKAMVTQCMTQTRHCPKALPVNMKIWFFNFCSNLFRFHFFVSCPTHFDVRLIWNWIPLVCHLHFICYALCRDVQLLKVTIRWFRQSSYSVAAVCHSLSPKSQNFKFILLVISIRSIFYHAQAHICISMSLIEFYFASKIRIPTVLDVGWQRKNVISRVRDIVATCGDGFVGNRKNHDSIRWPSKYSHWNYFSRLVQLRRF